MVRRLVFPQNSGRLFLFYSSSYVCVYTFLKNKSNQKVHHKLRGGRRAPSHSSSLPVAQTMITKSLARRGGGLLYIHQDARWISRIRSASGETIPKLLTSARLTKSRLIMPYDRCKILPGVCEIFSPCYYTTRCHGCWTSHSNFPVSISHATLQLTPLLHFTTRGSLSVRLEAPRETNLLHP